MDPIRRLTTALFISGGLNVVLAALFCYWLMYERPPTPFYELKPASQMEQQSPLAIDHSNNEVIRYFRKMPLEWLVTRLKNTQLVENGYTQRDLALAGLVAFHHFDLERAMAGVAPPNQKRSIVYGKFRDGRPAELIVYPGLTDKQFEAIVAFATRERWPLTSKGLFLALRKLQEPNPSLADTFIMTPEFQMAEMLFGRGEIAVDKNELLEVLLQGDWEALNTFAIQQRASQDLSPARRQRLLLDYIQRHSKAAAYLMLKTDGDFAARKLDDVHVLMVLQLLEKKNSLAEQFAATLLTSPRSDEVWKLAATRLYEYAGESLPDKQIYHAALSRFVPKNTVIQAAEPPAPVLATKAPPILPPPPRPPVSKLSPSKPVLANAKPKATIPPKPKDTTYIVQEGDNLWKIAKRHKIDMQQLKAYNKLKTDVLRPGATLKIPQKKG